MELGIMRVGYTEFSYGYAFTENLIRASTSAPLGAPVFPNLQQEGQSGFDVRINFLGLPLFFQYKLPELMRRGTAFEISKWSCPGLTLPFFRISLMRSDVSRQHKLLMDLEARYPACVFYAAAHLRSIREFDQAYSAAEVAQRSTFSPTDIGALPDNKIHTIAYRRGLATAYYCSEPTEIKAQTYDDLTAHLNSQFRPSRLTADSAREIRESVLELASPPMRESVNAIAERIRTSRVRVRDALGRSPEEEQVVTDILVTREIARVDLGVDLVLAQPRSHAAGITITR
jgi:hypothetical protein